MADGAWKTWTCFREHPCLDLMRSPPRSNPLPGDAVCYKRNSTDGSWILWGLQVRLVLGTITFWAKRASALCSEFPALVSRPGCQPHCCPESKILIFALQDSSARVFGTLLIATSTAATNGPRVAGVPFCVRLLCAGHCMHVFANLILLLHRCRARLA
jgi:hypothetical protein